MAAAKSKTESFSWAVKTGDLPNVKDFVEKDKMDVNMIDTSVSGRTPLHWASDFNQVEVIKYLVSKGAKVNAKDKHGITPLLAAAYEDHVDACKILVEKGADVTVKGPDGKAAAEACNKEELKKLLQPKKK